LLKEKNMPVEKKLFFSVKRPGTVALVALMLAFATGVQAQITCKSVVVTGIVAGSSISASTIKLNFENLYDNDTAINGQLIKLNSAQWTYASGSPATLLYTGDYFGIGTLEPTIESIRTPYFSVDQNDRYITAVIANRTNNPRIGEVDPDHAMALKIIGGCNTSAGGAIVSIHRLKKGLEAADPQIGAIVQGTTDSTYYATGSDRRLKDNIVDTRYSLDQLLKIQVRDYTFKSDPAKTPQTGFIAQELYEVYPDAVSKPGNEEGTWLVDYGRLSPILVKSIQDQQKTIEALEAENAELKAEIAAIKKKLGM
jgi:hypothetical protein